MSFAFCYCRYWLAPIGKSLGIKSARAKPPVPNKSLEDVYAKSTKLSHKTVSDFTKLIRFSEL